ncbi:MAG: PQQ-like beta-propeller repeat protein, partial [Firmicutes bacterium]|nr:PQQ-like beta-propeller repeat protein [Bacillota bacterium]
PLVTEDGLLVATVDDGFPKACGISLLSPTGEIKWFFQTENSVKNDFTLFNGVIYAQDHQGVIYALEAFTGRLLWQKQVSIAGHVGSALNAAIYKGKLFAGYCQQLTVLDPATGKILWTTEKQGWCNGASSRLNFYDNLVIVTANWGFIAAFDIETGEQVWYMKPEKQLFGYATPLLDGDKLIAPSGTLIFEIEAATGKVLDIHDHAPLCFNVCGQPVRDGDVYYLGTSEHGVVAVDAETFKLKQTFDCGPAMIYSVAYSQGEISTVDGSVLVEGDKLIFSASDGYLYVYNKNTGELLERRRVGAPSFVKPVRMGDGIVTADFAGNVIKFKLN